MEIKVVGSSLLNETGTKPPTSLFQLVQSVGRDLHSLSVVFSKLIQVLRPHLGVARRRRTSTTDVFHVDVDGHVVDVDRLLVGEDRNLKSRNIST